MVFGLMRKADDANFQSFEDSGICSFQEERNESLLGSATGSDGNNGKGCPATSRHICDLLGGLLDDDQLEQDLDEDLLPVEGSLKNDLTVNAHTRQNLLRAPSLKVQPSPCPVDSHRIHSDGKTLTARNHEFLRAPSMDRENEYVGIIEESDSESSETSDDTEYGNASAPLQFELPVEPSIPANGSSRKSLDCLESSDDQGTSSVNDHNVSITFTTCFDLEDDVDDNPRTGPQLSEDFIDLSELEANRIIDGETARRIRQHLQQKRVKEAKLRMSTENGNDCDIVESQRSHRSRKHRSPSHNGKTSSSKSEKRHSGSGSPKRHSERKGSPHLSPDCPRSKALHGREDASLKRSPRKNDGVGDNSSRRRSQKETENHSTEKRMNSHLSTDSRAATEVSKDRYMTTFESSPSRSDQNIELYVDIQPNIDISSPAKECGDNVDEKKRKSLLGSPGKMMMKFLSQRNIGDDKDRPTVRRSESQGEIGSSLVEVEETKLRSQRLGLDETEILDCSNRSSPRSSTRFTSWIRQGRRPSITVSGESHEKESINVSYSREADIHENESSLDHSDRSSTKQISSAQVAEFDDLALEKSKTASNIDSHFRQSHLTDDKHVPYIPSKIRPAIMRSSSLDVLYSPVRNSVTPEVQTFGKDNKASISEQTETISSVKRSKPTRRRSISVGASAEDDRKIQNGAESAEVLIEKVTAHQRREQSISPTKRSSLSAAPKHKKDLSQTQHPQARQLSATSTRTSKTRDLSNSCHVLKMENGHRNESPSQRSGGSRPLSTKNETPETPSKRRSSLTHQKGLSFSVHVSPTKRKSSTVVTRRLSALASVPVAEPPLHSTKGALTSNIGLCTSSNTRSMVSVSESHARFGKERKVVPSDQHSNKTTTDSAIDVRQQRAMSQSVHLSPTKRKNGFNAGASRRTHDALEAAGTGSYEVKESPDSALCSDQTCPSGTIKSTNGSMQAPTRTRKATVEDLKKDLDRAGEGEAEGSVHKNPQNTATRKIQIFSTKTTS
jgi:hypothetical protein